jgi:hypothetical protein
MKGYLECRVRGEGERNALIAVARKPILGRKLGIENFASGVACRYLGDGNSSPTLGAVADVGPTSAPNQSKCGTLAGRGGHEIVGSGKR